jgi:hypothetical protein
VISRLGLLILLVLLPWLAASQARAQEAIPGVEIQIPGATQAVRMAPADADAFRRRLNAPPPYFGPRPAGESVVVSSGYWDAALRADDSAPRIDADAAYFADGGIVRVRQSGRDLYFVLDLRQRAMLDRYVRLTKAGSLAQAPGALDVLIAAAADETVSIEIRGTPVTSEAAAILWRSLAGQSADVIFHDPPRPPAGVSGFWIAFTTAEGRSLQYFYDAGARTLTDSLGTESHAVPDIELVSSGEPLQIEQQTPPGSKLWWPVMLGGAAALLGAAVWLRRRDLAGRRA